MHLRTMNHKPTKRKSAGRPVKHPWERWLSGKRYKLVRGKHFECEAYALVLQLRRKAASLDKRVTAKVNGDEVIFKAMGRQTCRF